MQTELYSRLTSTTNLLQNLKNSQKSDTPSHKNTHYCNYISNMSRQNALILSQMYINEQEKYLMNLKIKNQPNNYKKTLSTQNSQIKLKSQPTQMQSSSSSNSSHMICKSCQNKENKENNKSKIQIFFSHFIGNQVEKYIFQLIDLINSSTTLKHFFEIKFGYVEKMEKLWSEKKDQKLMKKLLKVVLQIFKQLLNIKVDEALLTTRSTEANQEQLQSNKKKEEFNCSPRFNEMQVNNVGRESNLIKSQSDLCKCTDNNILLVRNNLSPVTSKFDVTKMNNSNIFQTDNSQCASTKSAMNTKQYQLMPHLRNRSHMHIQKQKTETDLSDPFIDQKKHTMNIDQIPKRKKVINVPKQQINQL